MSATDKQILAKCMAKLGYEKPHQCLLIPFAEFIRLTSLTELQGRRIWTMISQTVYPWKQHIRKASQMAANDQWISTGDSNIDKCLGGGIRLGSLIEVVGESAAGKTQLCLQLAISAQQGTSSAAEVVYISTEGAFPVNRLESMTKPFVLRTRGEPAAADLNMDELLDRMHVAEFEDMETMFHAMDYKIPALLSTGKVQLVVVDSIAAHLRFSDQDSDNSMEFYRERSERLISMAAKCKRWASEYSCAFLFINQVSDSFAEEQGGSNGVSDMSVVDTDVDGEHNMMAMVPRKVPALGSTWANIVDMRIMMYQRRGIHGATEDVLRTRRWIENDFCPWAPRSTCEVKLDESGFHCS